MVKKISFFAAAFSLAVLLAAGCGGGKKALQIKGSDTMVNLGQAWAEAFMKVNPTVPIAVTGGGSGTGIAAILSGTTDIAQTSRNMEKKELDQAKKRKIDLRELHVANDGIILVVNPANKVSRLTVKQLSDIYTGKISNWKEVGGANQPIVALSRERNSGTHVFFLEHVVKLGEKKNKNEFAARILMMPSSQAIIDEVNANPQAIGYVGLGYLTPKEKPLAIAAKDGGAYIVPSIKTVLNKTYPVSRSLLFYTSGAPTGEVKAFVDFVLTPAGQKIVKKMNFIPIK